MTVLEQGPAVLQSKEGISLSNLVDLPERPARNASPSRSCRRWPIAPMRSASTGSNSTSAPVKARSRVDGLPWRLANRKRTCRESSEDSRRAANRNESTEE